MKEKENDKVAAFDTLFTTNRIQMLKVLASYIDPSSLKGLAIYIKLLELQYTISFFQRHPKARLQTCAESQEGLAIDKLCADLLPLCDQKQKKQLEQIRQMYQGISNLKEMLEMVQMMQELFPDGMGASTDGNDGTDPFAMLSALNGMNGMPNLSGMDLSQLSDLFEMLRGA